MHQAGKKKRPPKFENLSSGNGSLIDRVQFVAATSDGASCNLDKTVKVDFGDQKDVLVCPSNLTVLQELGRGQYGIVERVCHKPTGCQFAVKRVPLRSGDNSEQQRLLMDVDILVKGTECKNIIKFFGALIWEGDMWILMELMDCSLDKFYRLAHRKQTDSSMFEVEKYQPDLAEPCTHVTDQDKLGNCEICNMIPEKVLGCIASDVLRALNYLYSIKVIHRDIKPSNILINLNGIVKLCDFGISGYLVDSVASTYEAGCQPYMAPERIDPLKARTGYDIKSDVWSFGITILEIAIGRYPYDRARNFFEQLKRICTDEPPRLPRGRFSRFFESFLAECLNKDYRDRPKFDTLESHPFILNNNNESDIKNFTQKTIPPTEKCPA